MTLDEMKKDLVIDFNCSLQITIENVCDQNGIESMFFTCDLMGLSKAGQIRIRRRGTGQNEFDAVKSVYNQYMKEGE